MNIVIKLNIKVPSDVNSADHLMLLDDSSSSLIKRIIKPPTKGRNIITESKGQSII